MNLGQQLDWVSQNQQAISLRDAGMQSAADHADRVVGAWSESAYTALCHFIGKLKPPEFTTEEVREWALFVGLEEPPDRRAWGSVMMRAVRRGLIYKVGYRAHRDPSRHKGVSTVWAPR